MSCEVCASLRDQDPLTRTTIEVVETLHNSCAPITHYTCRCRSCETRWLVLEVYDEDGARPSEYSWSLATSENRRD